ncbi:leucine-rich repeat and guanylate kinase domain-containing protein [Lampris incognitus]|uniref:leucine-rich repeat and guanylate kinase domain-containing protein n=1 Tax=Lampris incognitus TaxID=2546036 RepID=UPI0024B63012|nr:leucine-rich repeat and guanylate kinase domain-containing protein [Lampris incognitus]
MQQVKQATLHRRSLENEGVLTAEVVSNCLSSLGRSGNGLQYAYQCLSAPGKDLSDISILYKYVHLLKLELPHNKIKDLSCVSHMPYLIILDASHNELSDFFGFHPPKNLTEVSFSHNLMTKMKDLSAYSSLRKLKLDFNSFSEISGLEKCCSLTHLSLAHNRISRISGLDNLPLKDLCLRGNQLEKIEGLETLRTLLVLDLSLNHITSLSGLQNLHLLDSINLEKNLISEIKEASYIHDLFLLRELTLQRNPVQECPDYRPSVIFLLQHLTRLDQEKVTIEEKVSSVNKFDPPMEVVAARDHMTHLMYQMMQPQVLYDSSTMTSIDSPYPMLVLTGPQACGKRELAHKLCQEFSDYFAYGACHTTRGPYFGEDDGKDYHFVSEEDFQNMIHMGKFIQVMQYGGHWYGLTRDAVEDVAREGLASCVHMELEGVMSLKNSCFEPRYVLLIPTRVEQYTMNLKCRGLYKQAQIDTAVARIDIYARTNQKQPGFFDNVIPCDHLEEAYQTLRQVVKDYLGLEEQRHGDNSDRATSDYTSSGIYERPTSAPPIGSGSGIKLHSALALDPSDPSCRNYLNKIHAQLRPQKSSAELASIRRREQLVREALVGKKPGAYSQLFKRFNLSSLLNHPISMISMRIADHNVVILLPQYKSELKRIKPQIHLAIQCSDESSVSSASTVPSSAGAFSAGVAADGHLDEGSEPEVEPLDGSSLGHPLETLKEQATSSQTPDASRPGSSQLSAVMNPLSVRPRSNAKPILPSIPPGRKTPIYKDI